eukprot:Rhum_TRINITY_DN14928_c8_g1::Rhum_TRINITY_DN14928_c8_g1_i1::g.128557::m.128557
MVRQKTVVYVAAIFCVACFVVVSAPGGGRLAGAGTGGASGGTLGARSDEALRTAREAELRLWKETARSFLDRDAAALVALRQRGGLSPLHLATVKRMIAAGQLALPERSGGGGGGEGTHDLVLNQAADREFLREAEGVEGGGSSAGDSDGDGDDAGSKPEGKTKDASQIASVWPPAGDWGANAGHDLTTQNHEDLPTWDWETRYADMKGYYTQMKPTKGLLVQLKKVLRKVNKNWAKKDIWASYPDEDITQCPHETPECLFWSTPAINISLEATATHPAVPNSDRSYRKCCVEHRKMRAVTKTTREVLYNAGIDMWIGDGTLLGARRGHGTIIPWDTDIDVFAKIEDKQRIKEALHAAAKDGSLPHAWEKDPHGRQMYWVYYSKKKKAGDSHLEIWLTDGLKEKRSNFSLVYPLQPCPFYDFTVMCPQKINEILTIAYGHWQQPDKEKKV